MRPFLAALCSLVLINCGQQGPPGPSGVAGPSGTEGKGGNGGLNGGNGEGGANADGGTPIVPVAPISGTRIRSRTATTTITTTTSDGAKSVVSYPASFWFDELRNERCTFQAAGDGKTRCLPSSLGVQDSSGGSYFTDATTCTQAIAFTIKPVVCGSATVLPAPPSPTYFLSSGFANGCYGTSVRPIGTPMTPPANLYIKSGASCVGPIPSSPASYDYFTVGGAQIAPAEFVESTTTTETM